MEIKNAVTFDDVLLVPRVSKVYSRKSVDTSTHITDSLKLNVPILSSNMDTVTESSMAIAVAKAGGVGVIHRFNTIEAEADEITKVKREQNIVIEKPYTVTKDYTLSRLLALTTDKGVSSFPVVEGKKLVGMITRRDFQFEENGAKTVGELMTKDVITATKGVSLDDAKLIMQKGKVDKLPLVDKNMTLLGMITARDIMLYDGYSNASKDRKGRLMVGASIGIGSDYMDRVIGLVKAEADFIVIDVANGYLEKVADTVKEIKKRFDIGVIAGNVATKDGVLNLKRAGADAIKVGIGPGGACLTRPVAGVGYPQLSAIMECSRAGIPVIADGGIKKSADLSKAIAGGAAAAMIGGMFAGTDESPGAIVTKENKNYKFYRGMASVNAYSDRAVRIDEAVDLEGYTPEGTERLVLYNGSVVKIINNLVGGLRSAMTYLNSRNLKEFRKNARFVGLTEAGKKESKY